MKKSVILFFATILSINAFAQISFKEGYFIDNQNKKTVCFIEDLGWRSNPTKFDYKLTIDSENKTTAILSNVKEFGILEEIKFIRHQVNIDKSSNNPDYISANRKSKFTQETLFLRLLVDGSAKLFSYTNSNLERFFYSKDGEVKQLEYKLFYNSKKQIRENINYIKQLKDFLPCTKANAQNVKYKKKSLVKYFNTYNTECSKIKVDNIDYTENKTKGIFNIFVQAGLGYGELKVENFTSTARSLFYEPNITYSLGLEFEYISSFNNNKWSFFISPTFQSYNSSYTLKNVITSWDLKAKYSSLELPIGAKHYIFLNKKNKLFIKVATNIDIPLESGITSYSAVFQSPSDFNSSPRTLDTNLNFSFLLGFGYDFNNKFRAEINYNTPKDVIETYYEMKSDFDNISLKLSYNLL